MPVTAHVAAPHPLSPTFIPQHAPRSAPKWVHVGHYAVGNEKPVAIEQVTQVWWVGGEGAGGGQGGARARETWARGLLFCCNWSVAAWLAGDAALGVLPGRASPWFCPPHPRRMTATTRIAKTRMLPACRGPATVRRGAGAAAVTSFVWHVPLRLDRIHTQSSCSAGPAVVPSGRVVPSGDLSSPRLACTVAIGSGCAALVTERPASH